MKDSQREEFLIEEKHIDLGTVKISIPETGRRKTVQSVRLGLRGLTCAAEKIKP